MSERHHSLIGLPHSGKTTFLAALWHLLNSGETASRWILDHLDGDNGYLETIVAAWRSGKEVPHTSMQSERTVVIHVKNPATGETFALSFPDLSGESFDMQCMVRRCKPEYVERISGGGGILLFVNANKPTDGITILDLGELAQTDQRTESKKWTPKMIPEQVRLVELLQFATRRPFERMKRRVGVVISAWDTVLAPRPLPADWLARERPLLHQYLTSNSSMWTHRVFGVSAQGGDVNVAAQKAALLELTPSQKIECVGPGVESRHDLTCPVRWISAETSDDD
jgi:hypothetical protein